MNRRRTVSSELQAIPGIGPQMAKLLMDLGYRKTADLKGADPEAMYQRLCELRGETLDRCVLYVFRCAVYFINNPIHAPEKLKWWYWKDKG